MNAIDARMAGATWQRCRVHLMRNVLAKVPKGRADMVVAAIRTIFAQPTGRLVPGQVEVAVMLEPQLPAVAQMLRDAKEEITAFADFAEAHRREIWSTNPFERLNREVKRRTDVVGIFPNPVALLRPRGEADTLHPRAHTPIPRRESRGRSTPLHVSPTSCF